MHYLPFTMNSVREWLEEIITSPSLHVKLLLTIGILVFLWIDRKLTNKVIQSRYTDVRLRYQMRKTVSYVSSLVALILITWIWTDGVESIGTFLGLLSAGLVIALKDLMVDLAGWLFITWRKPFNVGDRIQIGNVSGDVIDIRPFQFTVLEIGNWVDADQSTGRIIHVPNGRVFSEPQASYTQGFQYIWNELCVVVTFESNWRKAKEILQRIANKHSEHLSEQAQKQVEQAAEKYFIFYSRLTPIVYTRVREYGVALTIRYLSEPRRRRGTEQELWEDILDEFAGCPDISFAYPTQRFYSEHLEGNHKYHHNHDSAEVSLPPGSSPFCG